MLYKYLTKARDSQMRSHELSVALDARIRELGGEIWYNTRAKKSSRKRQGYGRRTSHGDVKQSLYRLLFAQRGFGDMMDSADVPERQTRLSTPAGSARADSWSTWVSIKPPTSWD